MRESLGRYETPSSCLKGSRRTVPILHRRHGRPINAKITKLTTLGQWSLSFSRPFRHIDVPYRAIHSIDPRNCPLGVYIGQPPSLPVHLIKLRALPRFSKQVGADNLHWAALRKTLIFQGKERARIQREFMSSERYIDCIKLNWIINSKNHILLN